jgi:hypothetical protein
MFKAFPDGGDQLSKRIADFIVNNPQLAADLAHYVVNTPSLSRAQKIAMEHGLAAAMERLGINAALLSRPPGTATATTTTQVPSAPGLRFDPTWVLLGAAVVGGIVACALLCFRHNNDQTVVAASTPVSPN